MTSVGFVGPQTKGPRHDENDCSFLGEAHSNRCRRTGAIAPLITGLSSAIDVMPLRSGGCGESFLTLEFNLNFPAAGPGRIQFFPAAGASAVTVVGSSRTPTPFWEHSGFNIGWEKMLSPHVLQFGAKKEQLMSIPVDRTRNACAAIVSPADGLQVQWNQLVTFAADGQDAQDDEIADGSFTSLPVREQTPCLSHMFLGNPPTLPCAGGTITDPGNVRLEDVNGDQ